MAENQPLVPVFMPPLAALLARAEKLKGSRLTEAEVLRLRDGATCIMMKAPDADEMAKTRGYRDVYPENCWADWHRLRVQMTGNGYLPKIVLCILVDINFKDRVLPILEMEGVEHEWSDRNERMAAAFKASVCRGDPSITEEDQASIAGHSSVLYVLSKNFTAQEGPSVGVAFLRLGLRLLEAGGVALKCESSGIAHGRSRWVELGRQAETAARWSALLRAYVQMPIGLTKGDYTTCGLHLLGKPDLIVSEALLGEASGSVKDQSHQAFDLFRIFAQYLLAECPESQFVSGHTFSANADSPRFRVRWEECAGYAEDDFFFNPFGRWRFADLVG